VPRLLALSITGDRRPVPPLAPLMSATQLWKLTVTGAEPENLAAVRDMHWLIEFQAS
jgi:hypothetical protein